MRIDPTFSVIIPTFNRAKTVGGAVTSVLNQHYENYEIIIVDDGSTDNTCHTVAELADPRIQYIAQENAGAAQARNRGVALARGKYVAFLDSDDTFQRHHLGNALSILDSAQNICTYTQVIVDRGNGVTFLKPPRGFHHSEDISEYLLCDRGFLQPSTLIVPAMLAKGVPFDKSAEPCDDIDFAIRLVHAGGTLRMLKEPGAIWNDRADPNRLSSLGDPVALSHWLERLRPLMTEKAFAAAMGWHVAKAYARQGRFHIAIALFSRALRKGCYYPKLASAIFLQIILPPAWYRNLANALARAGVRP